MLLYCHFNRQRQNQKILYRRGAEAQRKTTTFCRKERKRRKSLKTKKVFLCVLCG
jgi:hypothetical protein